MPNSSSNVNDLHIFIRLCHRITLIYAVDIFSKYKRYKFRGLSFFQLLKPNLPYFSDFLLSFLNF